MTANVAFVPSESVRSPVVQRRCACGGSSGPDGECAACKAKRLQRQAAAGAGGGHAKAPPSVHTVLRGSGQPLDRGLRSAMEPRFGRDFSQVRIHADTKAGESARDVSALAYTVGRNIVFAPGQYQPASRDGQRLIAHELTHTVQQGFSATAPSTSLRVDSNNTPHEREAARASGSIGEGAGAVAQTVGPVVQRQATSDPDADPAASPGPDPDKGPGTIVIWFKLDSVEFRKDAEADSQVHFDDALAAVKKHLADAGAAGTITLNGYASDEGDPSHNLSLSQRRADKVKQLMEAAGVPPGRITAVGKGTANDFPGRQWNRRVEVQLEPKVTSYTFPDEVVEGKRPKFVCGPEVTKQVEDAVSLTQSSFAGWSDADRDRSCDALDSVSTGDVAWDIANLHHQDWILTYRPACASTGATPVCGTTVQVGDQCYYAGTANYVIFGTMCRLCFNHYASKGDLSGTYRFSKSSMRSLIDIYKGSGVTGLGTPAKNYLPAKQWSEAGFDGWPGGGTAPKGDRSHCSPVCPTPFSGPAFTVNWCPILWPTPGGCGR
jgi:outer membrane protein OmpA-like peptidoglycan-associated protein